MLGDPNPKPCNRISRICCSLNCTKAPEDPGTTRLHDVGRYRARRGLDPSSLPGKSTAGFGASTLRHCWGPPANPKPCRVCTPPTTPSRKAQQTGRCHADKRCPRWTGAICIACVQILQKLIPTSLNDGPLLLRTLRRIGLKMTKPGPSGLGNDHKTDPPILANLRIAYYKTVRVCLCLCVWLGGTIAGKISSFPRTQQFRFSIGRHPTMSGRQKDRRRGGRGRQGGRDRRTTNERRNGQRKADERTNGRTDRCMKCLTMSF